MSDRPVWIPDHLDCRLYVRTGRPASTGVFQRTPQPFAEHPAYAHMRGTAFLSRRARGRSHVLSRKKMQILQLNFLKFSILDLQFCAVPIYFIVFSVFFR